MEITEVRIKLVQNGNERLRAFCSVTLDGDFVVRDLKVIDGASGPFVAMPSRKLMDRCHRCGSKNHLRARFCNECGVKLNESRAPKDAQGRAKLHADVAHPINAACRERVQKAVVEAYHVEIEAAKSPDYTPASLDEFDDYEVDYGGPEGGGPSSGRRPAQQVEQEAPEAPAGKGDTFGDYNELIEDLKRQAQQRRSEHRANHPGGFHLGDTAAGLSPFGEEEPVEQADAKPVPTEPEPAPTEPEPAPTKPEPTTPPSGPDPVGKDDFGLGL